MLRSARLASINPATAERIAEYEVMSPKEVGAAIESVQKAQELWKSIPTVQRALPMKELSRVLIQGAEEHARLMAVEMGKPVSQGLREIEKCAWTAEYFAERAEELLKPEPVESEATRGYVVFEPLGVILGVMPWNFPYWQVLRFAIPTLMAGNGVVIKHASNVMGCALTLETLFVEAGFPANLVRMLRITADEVEKVIRHPLVRGVSLTGGGDAGREVASEAGRRLKPSVLELGGSDPYVILEDADLAWAALSAARARLINAGQSCVAAKRFVVVERVREEFEGRLLDALRAAKVGDPLDPTTDVGPLARHDLRETVHKQVMESRKAGAELLLGGEALKGPGAFYPPTLLTGVSKGMPAYEQEIFGPVAAVLPARNEKDALRLANDSVYGLGAAVFTRDLDRGERFARELESGFCVVNGQVASDPRMPFGGVKESGYGRELSMYGLREFVNIKSIVVYG
jgi:succinate-semialdehyde dehydrogenase/glutarate-semialdehyde dehydrogenase